MPPQPVVHRKIRRRFDIPHHARFLTFSCYKRHTLFANDRIKNAFVAHLIKTREETRFRLLAWVVMPEHVHLLIEPRLPAFPVAVVLSRLKGGFANRVLGRWRKLIRIGPATYH